MMHNKFANSRFCKISRKLDHSSDRSVQMLNSMERLSNEMIKYELTEVSKSFFAYQPVLLALQALHDVPLIDCLVENRGVLQKTEYFPGVVQLPRDFGSYRLDLDDPTRDDLIRSTSLDKSLADALHHALTAKVAMIQGPPGTGKTFIGSLVARTIRQNTDATILCVCYMNHALDQFLENMLAAGERRLVRMGARSKSQDLEGYSLQSSARHQRFDGDTDFCQR